MLYLVDNTEDVSLGHSLSGDWGSEEATGGGEGYTGGFATRPGSWNIKRLLLIKENWISQVKEFSAFLPRERCKSLGLLKPSFDLHLSSLGPASCVLSSRVPSGSTEVGEQQWLRACQQAGSLFVSISSALRPRLRGAGMWWWLDDCSILCLAVTFFIHTMTECMKNSPNEINSKVWTKYTCIKKRWFEDIRQQRTCKGLAIREKAGSLNWTPHSQPQCSGCF